MTKRINWNPVNDNSSSVEAVIDFARGISIEKAMDSCWDPRVKSIFRSLRKLKIKAARRRARRWVNKNYL
jgi:hypothetical protein